MCHNQRVAGPVTPRRSPDRARAKGVELNGDSPSEPILAEELIAAGKLTRFQAVHLLAGHTKLTLGPYRILDSLGQGGMGQVFKAEHSLMAREVAVKVLPKTKSTPESIANFTREIRAMAALDHQNLVRALDAGHDGNVYFLVCEYVPGADLRRYVHDRGPLGMSEAATIISQAAAGLAHAHRQGLIHRDVKPANLLVTPDGKTKVSDLGLAGSMYDHEDPRAGKVVGTADYLSPEQIISPRTVTTVSDIYSLGCTLYYAVTGKVPFPGGMVRDKARRHCEDSPLHPRLLNPSLSESFVEALAAMMEKDPQKRIQTAEEVIDRLKPWAGEAVSSPLDPDEARLRREQNWETGSGSGDLSDTTVSFPEFAQPGLRMVNGAMLQAQPGLAAPIPVPIVAPPGSIPSPAASATAAADPPYGTLRIIQPGPATVAQPSVWVAPTRESVAVETPAAQSERYGHAQRHRARECHESVAAIGRRNITARSPPAH